MVAGDTALKLILSDLGSYFHFSNLNFYILGFIAVRKMISWNLFLIL